MTIRSELKKVLGAASAALLLLTAACGGSGEASEDGPIRIGELHPITGASASYGESLSTAAELAVEQINEAGGVDVGGTRRQLELVTGDTHSDPTTGVAAFQRLHSSGTELFIGPLGGTVAEALIPIITRSEALLLIDGAATPGLTDPPKIFRSTNVITEYDDQTVATMETLPAGNVAIVTDKFQSSFVSSEDRIVEELQGAGHRVPVREYYESGDNQFRSQLSKILDSNIDHVVIRGYPTESALLTRSLRDQGYTGTILWEAVASPQQVTDVIGQTAANGVINNYPPTIDDEIAAGKPSAVKFGQDYEKRYGKAPTGLGAQAYDAINILKAAIEQAGSASPSDVASALLELPADSIDAVTSIETQDGGKLFNEEGQTNFPASSMVWENGAWTPYEG